MRFVAFGCSHTWGDGILPEDSCDGPPSSASWAQVLSNKFNVPVLNLSKSGGSNLLILHAIRAHAWQAGDIALIQWTYFPRSTIFDSETVHRPVSLFLLDNTHDEYVKQYYKLFPDYHLFYMSLQHIEHAYLYLEAQRIPKVARFVSNDISVQPTGVDRNVLSDFQKPTLQSIADKLHEQLGVKQLGADNMHLNSLCHQTFAEEFVPELTALINAEITLSTR
jgi:hypothetical protein